MTRLSSIAAQTLQRQIHLGQYPSGSTLPGQRELSASLGISRAALREAISTLEALGMVRSQPGKGVFVTAGNERSATDVPLGPMAMPPQVVFQFRVIVEPAAAALAARKADEEMLKALRNNQLRLESALQGMDLVTAADMDLEFHLALAQYSANPLLDSVIRSLKRPIGYSLRLPFADPSGVWAPANEHREVLRAIEAADPAAAHSAMTHHLKRAAERVGIEFETP